MALDPEKLGAAITGLSRGAPTLPTEIPADITLEDILRDWAILRWGSFSYERDFQIRSILKHIAASL